MTLLATLVRALASLPRRHRCTHCLDRFHSDGERNHHVWTHHYGEPTPKKEHAR